MDPQPSAPSAADRRQRARAARDAFPPTGVYAVRSGSRVIVGASRNVHGTLNRIRFELRLGSHPDKALQAAWNDAPERFAFDVLELVRERSEPDFDYAAELRVLEELHREELAREGERR
jgi:hypothetical protein